MSISLDSYREHLGRIAPEVHPVLEAAFHEAARTMTPAGVRTWLEGARALGDLGRGHGVVACYLEAMPPVAREVGEEAIGECVGAALKLASMTSGEVIGLFFATLPAAARRLGDIELLRGYIAFLHQMAARAPRGLRPMFGRLDELLSKLTLGGLRRWAFFGADAHRTDVKTQLAYFALETPDSRAVLRKERRGILFIDHQRRLSATLRALWGRDFRLRPAAADRSEFRPYLDGIVLHLPDAVDDRDGVPGSDLFRAIAAHMAAHLVYTPGPLTARDLNPAQRTLVGFMEDARVEHCAAGDLPGLRTLWRRLMTQPADGAPEHEAVAWLEGLALHLLDADRPTGDADLDALAARFHAGVGERRLDTGLSLELGLDLYRCLSRRRAVPSLRVLDSLRLPYRDDNRFVWNAEAFAWRPGMDPLPEQRQVRRRVSLMEMINEVEVETAGDDAQEIWVLDGELYDDDGTTFNEREGKPPVSDPFPYHEWDYRVQLFRPDWATVYEHRPAIGDPAAIDAILAAHRPVTQRLRHIVDRLRPQGVQRQRKLEDGDEIDLNAAVDALVSLRAGLDHDPRITMRNVLRQRDLSVLVLLDLSESTKDPVRGTDRTIIDLTREAAALVGSAVDTIGDPFAIHGFRSRGRHDVEYLRFKDFDGRLDRHAKARLAGMGGGFSTRMGTALRHAATHLLRRPQRRKLVLLVTDGEPADIDERDPQYLRLDAKRAVEELRSRGVHAFCLTLDPYADRYVERIFGPAGYTIVDRVERLPERLPTLFAELTG
ncbi:nitric oxide reductase activation protein NorD [Azospirillum halopraeferens]|uniref:nitric oxide reductase activation protein NorD n=1 Tax=Azospirillum halopraeferens TaxID=34010 RepID=UPI0004183D19|nr:VWA domain-containing protein [Azospirillum halopraeferens]